MKIVNKLNFKDSRDKSFCDGNIKRFIDTFIDKDIYNHIEITKSDIYLFKIGESGFSHFGINANVKTSREMLSYIVGLNSAKNLIMIKG